MGRLFPGGEGLETVLTLNSRKRLGLVRKGMGDLLETKERERMSRDFQGRHTLHLLAEATPDRKVLMSGRPIPWDCL